MTQEAKARIARRLERQARHCEEASPLYEHLLREAAADAERGGITWSILQGHDMDAPGSALALRFMGAVHRLVLHGKAPELAAHYPSVGGEVGEDVWDAFLETLVANERSLREAVLEPVQTNEVGRCTALVGGFLEVARRFGLPLRVLEIGASAGLNLRWNEYRYEARGQTWGDPRSPVRLCSYNTDALPPFDVGARVAERRGCDPNPLDATKPEDEIRLIGFVWPDQVARIRLLRSALKIAEHSPVVIDRSPGLEWVRAQLEQSPEGRATVIFHSIVEQYMPEPDVPALGELLETNGATRGPDAPLAHLRMEEGDESHAETTLQTWPGEGRRVIARSTYHGGSVVWTGY